MQNTIFNKRLIQRYDCTGPRYTSYPTALQFSPSFDAEDYKKWAEEGNNDLIPASLSLYFHIPFCESICYYCGCSKIVTRDQNKSDGYVELLKKRDQTPG